MTMAKITASRIERMRQAAERDRFHGSVDRFSAMLDRAIAEAGPAPEGASIIPVNGGYELREPRLMTSGRWEWVRVAWSRDRADMVESARLRGIDPAR
jgi:hypothetical protein